MQISVVFDVPGMTAQQYDEVIRKLEASGEGAPAGRRVHVAFPKPDGWMVVDVWESEEELGRFAAILMPLLAEAGVTPPRPRMHPIHSLVFAEPVAVG